MAFGRGEEAFTLNFGGFTEKLGCLSVRKPNKRLTI
jgi:hypothetical protein